MVVFPLPVGPVTRIMPCGCAIAYFKFSSAIGSSPSCAHISSKTDSNAKRTLTVPWPRIAPGGGVLVSTAAPRQRRPASAQAIIDQVKAGKGPLGTLVFDEKIGADMLLTISPYCRRPSQDEIFDSIVRIATATSLPVLTYNSPWRNGEGVEFTGELTARLIERLPNYIGMKDASFHSQKYLEISRVALKMRPGFAIIMGVEHLLASYPLGACGSFSSSGAIAPNLCNKFFASLEAHDWKTARECQFKISRLWNVFKEQYPSSLKGAMILMGRAVGPTRSPLPTATKERIAFLRQQLEELNILQTEPMGW